MPDGETKTALQLEMPGGGGEKPRLHYSWRCLRGETKTTLQLELPGGKTKTTLQLEMPAIIHEVKNQKFITRGDGWMTNGNYITDGGAWEEKSKIKPH